MDKIKSFGMMFIVPALLAFGLALAAKMAVNTDVSPVVDSGERWYNPFSWSLDESAALAHEQAQQAASIASTLFWAGIAAGSITLVMVTWASNTGRLTHQKSPASEAATETSDKPKLPAQRSFSGGAPVKIVGDEDVDPAFAGEPVATATGKKK